MRTVLDRDKGIKYRPVILVCMAVGYTIGSILIAFGLAVLYKIFTGSSTVSQIVYYPFVGIVLLIMGAWVCYGYMSNSSKNRKLDTDSHSLY